MSEPTEAINAAARAWAETAPSRTGGFDSMSTHSRGVVLFRASKVVAAVAPFIRRQVAGEIVDALKLAEDDYVKPAVLDGFLAGLSAAKETARRIGGINV